MAGKTTIIGAIINKHLPGTSNSVMVSKQTIARIADEFARKRPCSRCKITYGKGYKQGYVDRSNKIYEKAMFFRWKKYVAGKTEKEAQYPRINGKLEIIEPEIIIEAEYKE